MKVSWLLLLILISLIFSCSTKSLPEDNNVEINHSEIIISAEREHAYQLYGTLFSSLLENSPNRFPSYFIGASINEEDLLMINVTEKSDSIKKELIKIVGSSDFILETYRFSMDELNQVMDSINHFMVDHPASDVSDFVSSCYVDAGKGLIIVNLIKYDPLVAEFFSSTICNSSAIRFNISGKVYVTPNVEEDRICNSCFITLKPDTSTIQNDEYISFTIDNNNFCPMEIHDRYVEYFNGDTWERIVIQGFATPDILYVINARSSGTFSMKLYRKLYQYNPGRYRISQKVSPKVKTEYPGEIRITGEFTIED